VNGKACEPPGSTSAIAEAFSGNSDYSDFAGQGPDPFDRVPDFRLADIVANRRRPSATAHGAGRNDLDRIGESCEMRLVSDANPAGRQA